MKIWTEISLEKLNELVKVKFNTIRESILLPGDIQEQTKTIERAWRDYCVRVGIAISTIPDHETETRKDLPAPGKAMFFSDGTIRIRNIWGDKYIDMPEEFATRAIVLGFLP